MSAQDHLSHIDHPSVDNLPRHLYSNHHASLDELIFQQCCDFFKIFRPRIFTAIQALDIGGSEFEMSRINSMPIEKVFIAVPKHESEYARTF
jgi:hypothetical protein